MTCDYKCYAPDECPYEKMDMCAKCEYNHCQCPTCQEMRGDRTLFVGEVHGVGMTAIRRKRMAKKLSSEVERLLWNLLEECPSYLSCDAMSHHKKGDPHDYDAPCPPLARYEKAVNDAAEYFLRIKANGS